MVISLVGSLALNEGATGAETLWTAAHVDEAWQAERWGDDALAIEARAANRRTFDAAARFLELASA